jgi:Adenylate kinase
MKIANSVNEGRLVPEEIIFGLLSKRLEERIYRGETGFILDGIPRTRLQAVSSICPTKPFLSSICPTKPFFFNFLLQERIIESLS